MINIRPNSKLTFKVDTVIKVFRSDAALEFEKSRMLWEIGKEYGFQYPKPLSYDAKTDSVTFERIYSKASIQRDYLDFMLQSDINRSARAVFEDSGKVLGIIHKELRLTRKKKWIPSRTFSEAATKAGCNNLDVLIDRLPHAFLHGDFGIGNLEGISNQYHQTLAVFDASPNYSTTFHTNIYGPIYVDIGNFLGGLNGLVPLRYYPFLKWKRAAILQSLFCDGYSQTSGIKCDRQVARIFAHATASSYLLKKYKSRYLRNVAMWLLYNPQKVGSLS